MRILFICTGNTCRSPMAEHLLRHKLPSLEVKSAGIYAVENLPANKNAQLVLQEKGLEINHYSQPVTEKLLHWADLVITMTIQHKHSLILEYPSFQEKYYTLKEYVTPSIQKSLENLTKAYAQLEQERAQFIQEHEQEYSMNKLNELMVEKFKNKIEEIRQLEKTIVNGDVQDPFGGDIHIYRDTLKELDSYISKLAKNIKSNGGLQNDQET